MKIKEIDRTVNLAWSPAINSSLWIAAGTAAQQLDASFNTSSALEIFSLNLSDPTLDMELLTSYPSDYRFHKLCWGPFSYGEEQASGVIVGGCDGGRIQIYSSQKLIAGEDGLVAHQNKHNGPVRCLDFNPFQSNLLATGASESEIFIWDLNNITTPMTPGAKSQSAEDVVCLSWNKQVQHILASTFTQRCVVWDLRKNGPIIKLSDSSSRIRWKMEAWHPDVATQLCLASEDDQAPFIQLWDLRFASSPLKIMENHQRGVLSIAWCLQDPDLMISSGKDNKILCWNPNSNVAGGELLCNIATSNQWSFDVSWCPKNPSLIASSSFDGHVSIYSLLGGQSHSQTNNKIADSFPGMSPYSESMPSNQQQSSIELSIAPKWLKRPVGASFGFGGKLVTFDSTNEQNSTGDGILKRVFISQVVTEPELIQHVNQLEICLKESKLAEYCQMKAISSPEPHTEKLWNLLRAHFTSNPKVEMKNILGFQYDEFNKKLEEINNHDINKITEGVGSLNRDPPDGDALAIDDLPTHSQNNENITPSSEGDIANLISQSLLFGNIPAAVDLCLANKRYADAIILSLTGGNDLYLQTQKKYFQKNKGHLSSLINAVVTEDWADVLNTWNISNWSQALAAALTYIDPKNFSDFCEQLGARLENENDKNLALNAQFCYVCAGNLTKLIDNYTRVSEPNTAGNLQDVVELSLLLRKAMDKQGRSVEISQKLGSLLVQYASLLASQGNFEAALVYLNDCQNDEVLALKERLHRSLGYFSSSHNTQSKEYNVLQQNNPFSYQTPQENQPGFNTTNNAYSNYPSLKSCFNSTQGYPTNDQNMNTVNSTKPSYLQSQINNMPPSVNKTFTPIVQAPSMIPPPSIQQTHQTSLLSLHQTNSHSLPPPNTPVQNNPLNVNVNSNQYNNQTRPSTPMSGLSMSKNKYLVDPSVQQPSSGNINTFNPLNTAYNNSPIQNLPSSQTSPSLSGYNNSRQDVFNQPAGTNFVKNPILTPLVNPPAWNDPPILKTQSEYKEMSAHHAGTRNWRNLGHKHHPQPKMDYQPQNPIIHPLYGMTPQEQHQNLISNVPGPVMSEMIPNQGIQGMPRTNQIPPAVASMPVTGIPQGTPIQNESNIPLHQSAPRLPTQQQTIQPPTQPPFKPKEPLPEEYLFMQSAFDDLLRRCSAAANNPQTRRKLEDVAKKLEILYDSLRERNLSLTTLQGLQQLVQMIQVNDYNSGLAVHTQLVSGSDFSRIATFMPGIKMLLQFAKQWRV